MLTTAAPFFGLAHFQEMGFLIKYIKDGAFVGTEPFSGSLEDAAKAAAQGLKAHGAEVAAVMDEADMDGRPKALVQA